MKKLSVLFCAIALLFSSCSLIKETTFVEDNIAITLPAGFVEADGEKFDAFYVSSNYFVAYQAEDFEEFREQNLDPAAISVEEYAAASFRSLTSAAEPYEEQGLLLTEYTATTADGEPSLYLVAAIKTDGAFVTVQFGCGEAQFEKQKPEFLAIAKTVTYVPDRD